MKNLFIIRIEKDKDFLTEQELSYCFNDENLDWEVKSILIYLLSRPANWHLDIDGMSTLSKKGKQVVPRCMKKLIDNNYLFKIQKREGKKLKSWGYIVSPKKIRHWKVIDFLYEHCNGWTLIYPKNKGE